MIIDDKLALTKIRRPPLDAVTSNRYGFLNPSDATSLFKNDSSSLDSECREYQANQKLKFLGHLICFKLSLFSSKE